MLKVQHMPSSVGKVVKMAEQGTCKTIQHMFIIYLSETQSAFRLNLIVARIVEFGLVKVRLVKVRLVKVRLVKVRLLKV
jgi:hypothetical protein